MKLTKSKLKQLIKEALGEVYDEAEEPSSDENPDMGALMREIEALMSDSRELYANLPDEGKRFLTQAFEEHFDKWEQELEGGSEEALKLKGGSEEDITFSSLFPGED